MNNDISQFIELKNKMLCDMHTLKKEIRDMEKNIYILEGMIQKQCDHEWIIDRTNLDPCRSNEICKRCDKFKY